MSEPSLLTAVLLGAMEGLTEFLPISSSCHLILASHLLGFQGPLADLFSVVVQLGTIVAILIHFRTCFLQLIPREWPAVIPRSGQLHGLHLVLGIAPTALVGGFFYQTIKQLLTPATTLYGLLAGSLLLMAAEWLPIKKNRQPLSMIRYRQAFAIGCFQCLALWPGFSRSGATIAGAMLLGLERSVAIEFSFLLAVPLMIGASGLDLFKQWPGLQPHQLPLLFVGLCSSCLISCLTIRAALRLLQRITLLPFAGYRLLLAGLLYGLFY
jgi:undecaprenyl-diphosphatase